MVALLLFVSCIVADPNTVSTPTHTRPLTRIAQDVVDEAVRSSPTVDAMIAAIEETDLIVYVDVKPSPHSWRGGTQFIGSSLSTRFVQVTINFALSPNDRTEILGHELQHVLEIARAPDVRDAAGMKRLFAAIGWGHDDEFETAAAQDVEAVVHREILQHAFAPRPARFPAVRR